MTWLLPARGSCGSVCRYSSGVDSASRCSRRFGRPDRGDDGYGCGCCAPAVSQCPVVRHRTILFLQAGRHGPTAQGSSSFICSNKKTQTRSTREQEQDKKGTENWRLHFAHKKREKKTNTLDIKQLLLQLLQLRLRIP